MINFIKECINPLGRWNRKKFWLYQTGMYIVLSIILIILLIIFSIFIDISDDTISYLFDITFLYITIVSYIKRLRDLNKSHWYVLIICIPFINIYLWAICSFKKGTTGPNKYGPDPLGINNPINIVEIEKNTTNTTINPEIKTEQKIEL